jgi:hypothetical protein
MSEKTVRVDVNGAILYHRNKTGKTITAYQLGKHIFKGERIKSEASIKSMLSGWNSGDYSYKKCTVVYLVRIAKYTGIPLSELIII